MSNDLKELPEKFCIARNKNTYQEVNQIFGELYSRSYSHNGENSYCYMGDNIITHENFLHYPRIEKNAMSKRAVFKRPQKGYTLITLEQYNKLSFDMEKMNKDQWYLRGGQELVEFFKDKKINSSPFSGCNPTMGYYNNTPEDPTTWCSWSVGDLKNTGKKEITIQEFTKALNAKLEKIMDKKIVGYILKEQKYKSAVRALIEDNDWFDSCFDSNSKCSGFNFAHTIDEQENSISNRIKKAGVLDLWFEPVYEMTPKLPEIIGKDKKSYPGIRFKDVLEYGCAKLNIDWFRSSLNRDISEFKTNNGVLVTEQNVKQIRKYLDHHGWDVK